MNYDVDYFMAKFEAIPDEKWCVNEYAKDGQCCALGHCGDRDDFRRGSEESRAIERLFKSCGFNSVARINDGYNAQFPQPTPKQRILAALKFIKEKQ